MRVTLILAIALIFINTSVLAQGQTLDLSSANIDPSDHASLVRGAKAYSRYCLSCHSLQYQHYKQVAKGLQLSHGELQRDIMITPNTHWTMPMNAAFSNENMKQWLGRAAPDLTYITKQYSPDWLYTYLHAFYTDPTQPLGVNNWLVPNVSMPNVLQGLQGSTQAIYSKSPTNLLLGVKVSGPGILNPNQYDQFVRDLVNYLNYTADPSTEQRHNIGWWVLGFLSLFTMLAWLLKKEYWRDAH